MNLDEIYELVSKGESERSEFKKTTSALVPATETICAMLNHRGGHVIFGVTNDGKIVGQNVSGKTIEKISQNIRQIEPTAYPSICKTQVDGDKEAIVVEVEPGAMKPYRYKGIPYHRLGNTTSRMSENQANHLLFERMHGEQRWENQPAVGWSVENLDSVEILRTAEESIETGRIVDPGTRAPSDLLRGMGLIKDDQLLRAAVALFGDIKHIQPDMPQCLLRIARFSGAEQNEFIDNRQIHGNAFVILEQAEAFIRQNTPIASRLLPHRSNESTSRCTRC